MPKLLKFKENISPVVVQSIRRKWPDLYPSNYTITAVIKETKKIIYQKSTSKKDIRLKFNNLFSYCKESYSKLTENLVPKFNRKDLKKIKFTRQVYSLFPIHYSNEEAKITNWILSFVQSSKKKLSKKLSKKQGVVRKKTGNLTKIYFIKPTSGQSLINKKETYSGQNLKNFLIIMGEEKNKKELNLLLKNPVDLISLPLSSSLLISKLFNLLSLLNLLYKFRCFLKQKNIHKLKLEKSKNKIKIIKQKIKSLIILKKKENNTLMNLNQIQNFNQSNFILNRNKMNVKDLLLTYKNPLNIISTNKYSVLLKNNKNLINTLFPFTTTEISHSTYDYNFIKNNTLAQQKNFSININPILESFFRSMSSLISKPIFSNSPLELKILLFYYWMPLPKTKKFSKLFFGRSDKKKPGLRTNLVKKLKKRFSKNISFRRNLRKLRSSNKFSKFFFFNKKKLESLLMFLNKFFNKPIKIELIRLHYHYFDSNILINLIGFLISIYKFRFIWDVLMKFVKIYNPTTMVRKKVRKFRPSYVSGLDFKLAGRIDSKSLKSRAKSKIYHEGTLAREKANFVTFSRFTHKNKVGAYSITLNTGHLIVD